MNGKTKFLIQTFIIYFQVLFQTVRNIQRTIWVALSVCDSTITMINLKASECLKKCSKSSRETVEQDVKLNQDDVIS